MTNTSTDDANNTDADSTSTSKSNRNAEANPTPLPNLNSRVHTLKFASACVGACIQKNWCTCQHRAVLSLDEQNLALNACGVRMQPTKHKYSNLHSFPQILAAMSWQAGSSMANKQHARSLLRSYEASDRLFARPASAESNCEAVFLFGLFVS